MLLIVKVITISTFYNVVIRLVRDFIGFLNHQLEWVSIFCSFVNPAISIGLFEVAYFQAGIAISRFYHCNVIWMVAYFLEVNVLH